MATNDRHSGTLRTDYETDPAQLHGLRSNSITLLKEQPLKTENYGKD